MSVVVVFFVAVPKANTNTNSSNYVNGVYLEQGMAGLMVFYLHQLNYLK